MSLLVKENKKLNETILEQAKMINDLNSFNSL